MFYQSYIKDSSILRVIHSIETSRGFFNSENHLISLLHEYIGLSFKRTREIYFDLKKEGMISFENQQVKCNDDYDWGKGFTPNYILATLKIQDKSYWLRDREYEIICFLSDKRNKLHYVFENTQIKEADEILYLCADSIASELGYSANQVRLSLKKINNFFKDFWVKATQEERLKRIHRSSRSKTINLPNRKEWKRIIEDKVLEMTQLDRGDLILPVLIDPSKKKHFDKIIKKESTKKNKKHRIYLTLVSFGESLTHNKKQSIKLKEGKEKFKMLKAFFNMYCNAGRIMFEERDSYEELISSININNPKEFLVLIRSLENKLSIFD